MNAQMHAKGYGAPDTKASLDRARSLIERAEALGEAPEDPLALFSVLYGFWVANYIVSNGGVLRELGTQFLALSERQGATIPLLIAIVSWGVPAWTPESSARGERISIGRSLSTTPWSTGRCARGLGKPSGRPSGH